MPHLIRHSWPSSFTDPSCNRENKPRKTGITMVIDNGIGLTQFKDSITLAESFIDFIKLGFGTSVLYPKQILLEKIKMAKEQRIALYPGGTFFELAYSKGEVTEYLENLALWGFETIEISDGSIDIPYSDRKQAIQLAKSIGFQVITECGKKEPGCFLDYRDAYQTASSDLDCGADYIILEGRESGENAGIYDKNGEIQQDFLDGIKPLSPSFHERLIWEAPKKNQQVEFIQTFGSKVNLGNIQPQDIFALEALRRGLRSDTFFLHDSMIQEKA